MSITGSHIVDHVYKTMWQGPGQDIQHVVAPSRMTSRRGVLGTVTLGMKDYTLPTSDRYSIFIFGDVPHFMVGVEEYIDKWVTVDYHCNRSNTFICIYDNKGMVYPCFDAYFLYTRNGQVALALKNHQHTVNVLDDQIYVKWRSSSYFTDSNNLVSGEGIRVVGKIISSLNDISTLAAKHTEFKDRKGYSWVYKNGRRIERISITNTKLGDYVEIIWDGSVREVLRYKLKDLEVFDSTLDLKSKYLIPNEGYGETVDYNDDLDIFLLEHKNENEYDGVYYHHNQKDTIRNITHRDFSTPTSYVVGIIEANVRWNLSNDNRLEILIRHSGWIRPIPNVHSKLYELFRLDHNRRIEAMLGEQALIPEWTAANLESSYYSAVMRKSREIISTELAENALGYDSISRLTSPAVYKRNGLSSFKLGKLHHYRSTVYEYNSNGRMIGFYNHATSPDYHPRNELCEYIEVYFGKSGPNMGTVFGKHEQTLDKRNEYRFYISYKLGSGDYGNWVDVTGDSTKYNVDSNGNLTWLVNKNSYLTAVRKDCDLLSIEIELDRIDRLLLLSIQTDNVYQDKGDLKGWLEIPPGEMDIFLNGYHLVENIDYHVNWPEVCIVNTIHRSQTILNKIVVRARGFCNKDLSRNYPKDVGYVYNREIGRRDKYQVFEGKNTVIHSNGRLVMESSVFNEDWSRKKMLSGFNGRPFQIRHPITPFKDLTIKSTTELFDEARDLDNRIENYLTDKLGIVDDDLPRDIDNRYVVVSPFMNKLLHDLLNGILSTREFEGDYSNAFLLEKVSRYNYLLPYEPTKQPGYMPKFMEVHPHPYLRPISVNVYQYRILDRVTKLIFDDLVSLDRGLLIIEEGYEHDARYHPHPKRTL